MKLAALLLITACLYAPVRFAPFVYEDDNWRMTAAASWRLEPGRSLSAWSLVQTPDPATAHLVNVGLHLVNGALVYGLGSVVAGPSAALVAAGVFLLHPLNSEAVAYVAARTDLLMTLGVLLAAWSALTFAGAWRWGLVAAGLLIAATGKEIGAVGVLLLAITVAQWRPDRRVFGVLALIGLVAAVIFGAQWMPWASISMTVGGSAHVWSQHLHIQMTALWGLLSLIAWPVGFTIDHDWLAVSPAYALIASLLTCQALGLLLVTWRSQPVLAWGLAWVAVSVAPRFLFRTNEFLNEHQMYLAMVGASVLIGAGVAHLVAVRPRQESFA